MAKSFEGTRVPLDTQDLLSAVKTVCNNEGDLFDGNRLIMSCLGLSRSENTRVLLKHGITSYVNQHSNTWNYRYTDPSKNLGNYYVYVHYYSFGDRNKIDFTIKDYRLTEDAPMFPSLADVMEFVRNTVIASPYTYIVEEDIYVNLYSADGQISFAPGDWQTVGEPEMFFLVKDGKRQQYGSKHYLQRRYDTLQPKFGGYELIPATKQTRGLLEAGDVVSLEKEVESLKIHGLYLITNINTSGEQPVYTIRDLDDYELCADVSGDMISIPNVAAE